MNYDDIIQSATHKRDSLQAEEAAQETQEQSEISALQELTAKFLHRNILDELHLVQEKLASSGFLAEVGQGHDKQNPYVTLTLTDSQDQHHRLLFIAALCDESHIQVSHQFPPGNTKTLTTIASVQEEVTKHIESFLKEAIG